MPILSTRPLITAASDTSYQHVVEAGVSSRITKANYLKDIIVTIDSGDIPVTAQIATDQFFTVPTEPLDKKAITLLRNGIGVDKTEYNIVGTLVTWVGATPLTELVGDTGDNIGYIINYNGGVAYSDGALIARLSSNTAAVTGDSTKISYTFKGGASVFSKNFTYDSGTGKITCLKSGVATINSIFYLDDADASGDFSTYTWFDGQIVNITSGEVFEVISGNGLAARRNKSNDVVLSSTATFVVTVGNVLETRIAIEGTGGLSVILKGTTGFTMGSQISAALVAN